MTLILSCLTHDLAIQVSDRRLTKIQGIGVGEIFDDDTNKAVLFCNTNAFAYTGLAHFDGVSGATTDDWLAEILSRFESNQILEVFAAISGEATAKFNQLRRTVDPALLRHAFVGVGWATFDDEKAPRPYCMTISNGLDQNDEWLDVANSTFDFRIKPLEYRKEFEFVATGQTLLEYEKTQILRLLRECVRRNLGPDSFARVLVAGVRKVAKRNRAVGQNIMVTSLPRAVAETSERGAFLFSTLDGKLDRTNPMFLYVYENSLLGKQYAPRFVCGGLIVKAFTSEPVTEFDHTPVEPPWLVRSIVLSPREKIDNPEWGNFKLVPLLTRDFAFPSFNLFGYVGNQVPGPCVAAVEADPITLGKLAADERFLVLIATREDAGARADADWIAALSRWMIANGFDAQLVSTLGQQLIGKTVGEVVFDLRTTFHQVGAVLDGGS